MGNRHGLRCDWCGRFRKSIDLYMYSLPDYWREAEEYFVVCRWCSPNDFKEDNNDS